MIAEEERQIAIRAAFDCIQDHCENIPFACIGGLESRSNPQAPGWIEARHAKAYVQAYCEKAKELYGDGWQLAEFSWRPTLTINT